MVVEDILGPREADEVDTLQAEMPATAGVVMPARETGDGEVGVISGAVRWSGRVFGGMLTVATRLAPWSDLVGGKDGFRTEVTVLGRALDGQYPSPG